MKKKGSGTPAGEPQILREDSEGSLSVYPDGRAELVIKQAQDQHTLMICRLWGLFITSYLFWPLIPAPLVIYYWGPVVKAILLVLVVLYTPKFLDKAEQKGGREWDMLRMGRLWRLTHRYFGTVSTREAPLDPKKQFLITMHPHGILILSKIFFYGGVWEDLFPGVHCRVLGATPMFYIPFCREICLWMSVVDAGRKYAERFLSKGVSLMLYPGGSKEIFLTDPDSTVTTIILKERKGFIRLALRSGAHLVPSFIFGEKWAYNLIRPPPAIKDFFLKKLKIPVLLFWGKYGTFVPKSVPLMIVYGKPIEVQKTENPTDEQVEELQRKYEAAVRDIFDRYKKRAGYADNETLEII